jgi:hypothetical protein
MSQHAEELAKTDDKVEEAKEAFRKYLKGRDTKERLTDKAEDIKHILKHHKHFYRDLTEALTQQLHVMAEGHYGDLSAEQVKGVKKSGEEEATAFMQAETGTALLEHRAEVIRDSELTLTLLQELQPTIPFKIAQAKQIVAALENLCKYDFVNGILPSQAAAGLTFVWDKAALSSGISELERRQVTVEALIETFDKALSEDDEKERTAACEAARKKLDKTSDAIFLTLEKISVEFVSALETMTVTVEEKALSAYISETSASVGNIKVAKGTCDLTIGLLGVFLKKTNLTGAFVRLADLLSSVSLKVAKEVAIQAGMDEFNAKHTATEIFDKHDDSPLLMALRLVDMQQDGLEIVLKGIGATLAGGLYVTPPGTAEFVLGAWDVLAETVTSILETYLRKRIADAKKQLTALQQQPLKSGALLEKVGEAFEHAYGEVEEKVTGSLTGEVKEFVSKRLEDTKELLSKPENLADAIASGLGQNDAGKFVAKFDPFALSSLIAQLVVPPITEAIMRYLPPEPAQLITGEKLIEIINDIHFSQQPLGFFVTVEPTDGGKVVGFKDGDPEKELLNECPTWNFRHTNSGATAFADDPEKILYSASVGSTKKHLEVWGYYNPRTTEWIPDHLDSSVFTTDWSTYKVYADGVSSEGHTGKSPETEGKWYTVDAYEASEHMSGITYIVFLPDGGEAPMWGHRMDMAKGPKGPRYSLGVLVEKFAQQYPGNMLGLMDTVL